LFHAWYSKFSFKKRFLEKVKKGKNYEYKFIKVKLGNPTYEIALTKWGVYNAATPALGS
jgi:hypothetical protein